MNTIKILIGYLTLLTLTDQIVCDSTNTTFVLTQKCFSSCLEQGKEQGYSKDTLDAVLRNTEVYMAYHDLMINSGKTA